MTDCTNSRYTHQTYNFFIRSWITVANTDTKQSHILCIVPLSNLQSNIHVCSNSAVMIQTEGDFYSIPESTISHHLVWCIGFATFVFTAVISANRFYIQWTVANSFTYFINALTENGDNVMWILWQEHVILVMNFVHFRIHFINSLLSCEKKNWNEL